MVIGHFDDLHLGDLVGVESAIGEFGQWLMIWLDYHSMIGIQGAGPLTEPVRLQRVPPSGSVVEVGQTLGLLEKHDPPLENWPAAPELSPTLLVLRAVAFKPSIGP